MNRPLVSVACLSFVSMSLGTLAAADGRPDTRQVQQRFDVDPRWDAKNNRIKVEKPIHVVQDFGYSQTQHAGGKGDGEFGGRIQRSNTPAFYALRLAQPRTLEHKLHCSGRFAVTQSEGMSSLCFGWLNTKTMEEVRPRNWMGLWLNGEGRGCGVLAAYNTADGVSDGIRVTGIGAKTALERKNSLIPNDGTQYTFDFTYDPQGNNGGGEITFTLGGSGPHAGGPFVFKLPPSHRKSATRFDAFGIANAHSQGNPLTIYFDDLEIDGQTESFDHDPKWLGEGNHAQHDDYGLEGAHQFGFSSTSFAGGTPGELGGLLYSSPTTPGYYGDDVGKLTLENRLVASGKVTVTRYGPDAGAYLGWFNSEKRGFPPADVLGVFLDGPISTGPRFRGRVASSDSTIGHCQYATAPFIPADGRSHTWKIEYQPESEGGQGRMTVWLDDRQDSFVIPREVRKRGATFDRFGLFVHEQGGRACQVYLDDLEYTSAREAADGTAKVLQGHTGSVLAVAFSPNGKTLASCSRDATIKLWNVQTGEVLRTITEQTGDVYDVVYSPLGDLLASGGRDKVIKLWNPQTGQLVRNLDGHTDIVRSVAFSPDQRALASASVDMSVRLWDVSTGTLKQTLTGHTKRVMSVDYAPDGRTLASASSDGTARFWEVSTGKEQARLEGHSGGLESAAFSSDGKLLATSGQDGSVRLWNVETKALVRVLEGHVGEVDSVTFAPQGTIVVSGCKDRTIKLWDVGTGRLLRTLTGHTGRIESLDVSPDGRRLASGGGGGDTSVRLWMLPRP